MSLKRFFLIPAALVCSSFLFAGQPQQPQAEKANPAAEQNPEDKPAAEEKPVDTQPEFPEWDAIEPVIKTHFEGAPEKKKSGRRPRFLKTETPSREHDLITQKDLSGLFEKIEKLGWKVSTQDRKRIPERMLSDQDDMVRRLSTRDGKKFMRNIGSLPGGYDRLDRLRNMPHGKKRIKELIEGPDGHLLIEFMTSTKYGKNLGKQLSKAKNGRNFNQPTGKLYTPEDVLKELEKSYQAEVVRREKDKSAPE